MNQMSENDGNPSVKTAAGIQHQLRNAVITLNKGHKEMAEHKLAVMLAALAAAGGSVESKFGSHNIFVL